MLVDQLDEDDVWVLRSDDLFPFLDPNRKVINFTLEFWVFSFPVGVETLGGQAGG